MTASSKPSVRMWWPSSVLGTKSRAPTSYTPPTLPGSVRCRARHRAWHCRPGEMGPPLPWSHSRTAARTAGALRVAVAFAQLRAARPALCFDVGGLQLRGHRMRVALSQSLRRVARPSEGFDRLLIVRSLVEPPPPVPPVHRRGSAGAYPSSKKGLACGRGGAPQPAVSDRPDGGLWSLQNAPSDSSVRRR